ncbi:MAG: metal ABC transporter substrate-binding protein [Fervidobacterium sp.]|uniref:metal ABC transporter substrate-binding protein n=1 Tax=Fervidobacterium sp. TaxID=1871331 RepID=UPI0040496B3E
MELKKILRCAVMIPFLVGSVFALNIVVTINPYYLIVKDMVKDVSGVSVSLLIKPGSDPHTFSPSVSDMKVLAKADIIFANSLGLDDAYLKNYKNVVYLGDYIPKDKLSKDEVHEDEHEEGYNPHVWLSPEFLAKYIVPKISDELSKKDAKNAEKYKTHAKEIITSLMNISSKFDKLLSGRKNAVVILDHPSYFYLFKKYNINILSVEEGHGKQPSAKHIKEIVEEAKKNKLIGIFVGPQFNKSGIETISKELKRNYKILDPIGAKAKSITELFESAYVSIKEALDGK